MQVDIADRQPDDLGDPGTGAVERLQQRASRRLTASSPPTDSIRRVTWSSVSALGRPFGIDGISMSAAGSSVRISSATRNRCRPRTATSVRVTDEGANPSPCSTWTNASTSSSVAVNGSTRGERGGLVAGQVAAVGSQRVRGTARSTVSHSTKSSIAGCRRASEATKSVSTSSAGPISPSSPIGRVDGRQPECRSGSSSR